MKKEYDLKKLKKVKSGPVVDARTKVSKTIRLDLDIVHWLLQEAVRRGLKYQTLINTLLRESMISGGVVLTKNQVRAIVNEELKRKSS